MGKKQFTKQHVSTDPSCRAGGGCMYVRVCYLCVEKTWKDMHGILIMAISEGWLLLSISIVWKFSKEFALHL